MHYGHAWRWREIGKFASGEYRRPPWRIELLEIPDHFAHVSQEDSSQIAFTQSVDKGERDIQTRMRPGRYLTKFYPDLTNIPELATHWQRGDDLTKSLFFARTPDEIEYVYNHGPASCMKDCDSVRAYGNSDFAVAYLKVSHSITARTVVAPERKLHSTLYGDTVRLDAALKAYGFQYGEERKWIGLKLKRLDPGEVLMKCPYLDMAHHVEASDEYLIVSNVGMDARSTSGTIGGQRCEDCEQYYDHESEGIYIDCHGGICDTCSENYFCCEECDRHSRDEESRTVFRERSGRTVEMIMCESCAPPECSHCDVRHADYVELEGDVYCPSCVEDMPTCHECGDCIVPPTQPIEVHEEQHCQACAADHAVDERENAITEERAT